MKLDKKHLFVALTISSAAAFTLCGYEFVRSTSNTLFKAAYGAEHLPFVMALVPVMLWLMLTGYGRMLSRFGPRKTLVMTTLLSGLVIFLSFFAIRSGRKEATAFLFLFREAYIVLLIEQYWSFINSSLDAASAKKLNGPICGLASFGSMAGGFLLYRLATSLGTSAMLLFAAAATLPAAFISDFAYAKIGEDQRPETRDTRPTSGKKDYLGLKEFRLNPFLIFLFLVVITTQIVSATLDIRFQGMMQTSIPNPDKQTAFSGLFFGWVAVLATFLQFVVAPFVLHRFSLKKIYFFIPLIHVATCLVLIFYPSLTSAGVAFLLFKSFDYSLFKASKEILYIPLSFDARYRAKEVIDAFGYRFGKGGASFLLALFQRAGVVLTNAYSMIALAASFVWLGLIFPLIRYRNNASATH